MIFGNSHFDCNSYDRQERSAQGGQASFACAPAASVVALSVHGPWCRSGPWAQDVDPREGPYYNQGASSGRSSMSTDNVALNPYGVDGAHL